jgi:hypothetical protein
MLVSSLLGDGKFDDALKILLTISVPNDRKLKLNYLYQSGECSRLLGHKEKALEYFNAAEEISSTAEEKHAINSTKEKLR